MATAAGSTPSADLRHCLRPLVSHRLRCLLDMRLLKLGVTMAVRLTWL